MTDILVCVAAASLWVLLLLGCYGLILAVLLLLGIDDLEDQA